MKQVILLESHEVAKLQRGKSLEIALPNGGTLAIGFVPNINANEPEMNGSKIGRGHPIPQEQRKEILKLRSKGLSVQQIAIKLGIPLGRANHIVYSKKVKADA